MKTLFTIFLGCLFMQGFSQAGTLDLSFGDGGKVETLNLYFRSVLLQADGKIIAGGGGTTDGIHGGFCLARFFPDGKIDSSFANNGINIINNNGNIYSLAINTEGKIIAAGGYGNMIIARYMQDGKLDSSFGKNGIVSQDFGTNETVFDMGLQTDGKIVVTGIYSKFTHGGDLIADFLTARFLPDGSLDESFNGTGFALLGSGTQANALVIQPDGKIIVGGKSEFTTARYLSDGTLDNTYGINGVVRTHFSEDGQYINDLVLQPDGKILAAGVLDPEYGGRVKVKMALARYNPDGSLDEGFGNNGLTSIPFYKDDAEAASVLLQADGKIILAGRYTDYSTFTDFALARVNVNGTIDSSFGMKGLVTTDLGGGEEDNAAVLQSDGKIIAAGSSGKDVTNGSLVRYNNDEVMPLHFTYFNAASTTNGSIALNWQTAQENNNDHFAVQRSGDSRFSRMGGTGSGNDVSGESEIARINSKGNSSQAQTYSYTDNTPLQGTNFYRLKQVDKDGKFSYSQVVSATVEDGLTVVLYPNPVKDVLNIKGLNAGMSYELSVMSAKGNLVRQTSISNTSSYRWNLQRLSKGVYYLACRQAGLSLTSTQKTTTVKFVKE